MPKNVNLIFFLRREAGEERRNTIDRDIAKCRMPFRIITCISFHPNAICRRFIENSLAQCEIAYLFRSLWGWLLTSYSSTWNRDMKISTAIFVSPWKQVFNNSVNVRSRRYSSFSTFSNYYWTKTVDWVLKKNVRVRWWWNCWVEKRKYFRGMYWTKIGVKLALYWCQNNGEQIFTDSQSRTLVSEEHQG